MLSRNSTARIKINVHRLPVYGRLAIQNSENAKSPITQIQYFVKMEKFVLVVETLSNVPGGL